MRTRGEISVAPVTLVAGAAIALLAGCDPILSIDGAFFPAWLLCLIVAGGLLAIIRFLVRRAGIEPFIGPKLTVYFCVYLSCTLGLWLGFFRT